MDSLFTKNWFENLDKTLRKMGADSDAQSFDEIKRNLSQRHICNSDEFASNCIYVILAGGFSQKTAKKIHEKIMESIKSNRADYDTLITLFNNKNKINAICKIWQNRCVYTEQYYKLHELSDKIKFLVSLPHIGKITANHLARNLGEDVVKYDIWIQRLGAKYAGVDNAKIDNGNLCDDIKFACDDMFMHLVKLTGLPRGYIDVVLWKACQQGLIKL
ncbi:MAG: hypothetical protein KBS86_03895 [Proteobacteria bacterium]|nr:hypothetical protein [Candidatus Enterousia scatequi]